MFKDRAYALIDMHITYDQYVDLLAEPEHRAFIKKIGDYMRLPVHSLRGDSHVIEFGDHKFVACLPFGKMALCNTVADKHSDPELLRDIGKWAEQARAHSLEFARADRVLRDLQEGCTSPMQVRYVWPSILSLCSAREELSELAEKIRPFKVPRTMPALHPGLRDACKKTAGIIAAAQLLPDPSPKSFPSVRLLRYADETVEEPGIGTLRF